MSSKCLLCLIKICNTKANSKLSHSKSWNEQLFSTLPDKGHKFSIEFDVKI